ncbi:MAG: XkdF-like putative serine protease domain-containing protein [Thermoleophilia bacterium]
MTCPVATTGSRGPTYQEPSGALSHSGGDEMAKLAGSYESRIRAQDAAVRAATPYGEENYVDEHHEDHVVVRDYKNNKFWRVACSFAKDGTVTLGERTEVEQVYAEVKKDLRLLVPVQKAAGARRISYGVVLEPDTEDLQGDVMKAEDIELSAHSWMEDSQVGGEMHTEIVKGACVVESFLAPADFEVETADGTETVSKGSWVLAMRWPEEIWKRIEAGELTGYSVGGQGVRLDPDDEEK